MNNINNFYAEALDKLKIDLGAFADVFAMLQVNSYDPVLESEVKRDGHKKGKGEPEFVINHYKSKTDRAIKWCSGTGDAEYPLILACIDISGIQSFLYDITSSGAAKSLKGRSFYIQAMIDDVSYYIIDQIGGNDDNIVYSGGGKVFLLLPNNEKVKSVLSKTEEAIENALWDKYRGELYFCFGMVEFKYIENHKIESKDFDVSMSNLWQRLSQKTSEKKRVKFKNLMLDKYDELFKPFGNGGQGKICAVTGVETKCVKLDDILVSKDVKEQIDLGNSLVNHKYIAYYPADKVVNKESMIKMLTGRYLYVGDEFPKGDGVRVVNKYYGGATVPMKENPYEAKTFDDLAQGHNFNKLGVLRMDVDNLGQLFIGGFKSEDATMENYAMLSGLLDMYFSGYLNVIRETNDFKDDVMIVYSGGDDLFAVGSWCKLIDFSDRVQSDFKKFTGRDDITISGGMAIVDGRFPIRKAAEIAGKAEEKSKGRKNGNGEPRKNAITIFDVPIGWDGEFQMVRDLERKFDDLRKKKVITKGLIMQILRYYENYKQGDIRWQWHLTYNIARRKKDFGDATKKEKLEELKNMIMTKGLSFDVIAVACRLVELNNREENKINNNLKK